MSKGSETGTEVDSVEILGIDDIVDAPEARPASAPAFAVGSGIGDLDAMLAAYLQDIDVGAPGPADRTGCVLVVEHEPSMRRVLGEMLEAAGHRVLTASSAAAAMTLLERHVIDVVLADAALPDAPGATMRDVVGVRWPGATVLLLSDKPVRGLVLLAAITEALRSSGD